MKMQTVWVISFHVFLYNVNIEDKVFDGSISYCEVELENQHYYHQHYNNNGSQDKQGVV